jgi:hypothetical protein
MTPEPGKSAFEMKLCLALRRYPILTTHIIETTEARTDVPLRTISVPTLFYFE